MLVAVACAVGLLGVAVKSWSTAVRDWPPFLRASAEYPPDIADRIERLWLAPTFTRTVSGDPASVPLALDQGVRDGRLKKGDLVVLEAMGGGFTWGAAVVRL